MKRLNAIIKTAVQICLNICPLLALNACHPLEAGSLTDISETKTPEVVADLAYDEGETAFPILYLAEEGVYQPYIVMTNDYNGSTLLLRQYLLPDSRRFNEYLAYYESSEIDKYLNRDFFNCLSEDVQELVISSDIEILDDTCLGIVQTDVTMITRKIFLLSFCELGYDENGHVGREGNGLAYFSNVSNRVAYMETGELGSWWLRSADSNYSSCVYAVGPGGEVGSTNAFAENGIRPAFCISGQLPVESFFLEEDNRNVYILAW